MTSPFALSRAPRQRAARAPLVSLFAAVCCAAAAMPQPAALAAPFAVSSCTDCTQRGAPAAAGSPQGQVLTAWTGGTSGPSHGVAARFFLANGAPRGVDVALSTAAPLSNGDVAVTSERSGFFLAAWSAKAGLNGEIFVQRFRRTLDPIGTPIQVSLDDPSTVRLDFAPTVAYLPDGTFVVLWERYGPAFGDSQATLPEVMSRRFRFRDGRPLTPPQVVSTGLIQAGHAALCMTRTGALAAAWNSVDGNPPFQQNRKGVILQRLTPGAQPLGSPITVVAPATTTDGVALACGSPVFTVLWRTDQSPANGVGIVAQRISTAGIALGSPFAVSGTDNARVSAPAASEDVNGNVVAVWSEGTASEAQISTRTIAATTGELGPIATVTSLPGSTGVLPAPAVAHYGRAGSYLLVWSPGNGGPLGQRFAAGGSPLSAAAVSAAAIADDASRSDDQN